MGKHKPRKGRATRKARAGQRTLDTETLDNYPHSLVFKRGHVGKSIQHLIHDVRKVMEPFTASNLKVRKGNVLKDFVAVANSINVTHFITFSKTEISAYMKIMRLPHGPTLTFKVDSYALISDVVSSIKRHHMDAKQFLNPPLMVVNKFSGDGLHLKLMSTTFQNLFPPLEIEKIKLNDVRRCVLFNYDPETKTVQFRHYNIRVVPVGLSRSIKKLVGAKLPNMGGLNEISEFMNRGNASESEAELDGPHNEVQLPQDLTSRGNIKSSKSAIRLTEIGPRINLRLVKIEEGLGEGEILYHDFITKTEEEKELLKKMRSKKKKIKQQRRQQQQENVDRKAEAKKARKRPAAEQDAESGDDYNNDVEDDDDDDAEYFRKEVGHAPDKDLGISSRRDRGEKRHQALYKKNKRVKFDLGAGDESKEEGRGGKFRVGGFRGRGGRGFSRGGRGGSRGEREDGGFSRGDRKFSRDDKFSTGGRGFSRGGRGNFRDGKGFSRGERGNFRGGRGFSRGGRPGRGGHSREGRGFSRGGRGSTRGVRR